MFRNYLQVAFRNLIKNPVPAIINIAGLVIGMTAFVLLIQYIRFELSYDNFHEKSDRIFRVQQDRYMVVLFNTGMPAGFNYNYDCKFSDHKNCKYKSGCFTT